MNDRFISMNRSTVHEKTKVVKQVYVVKNDGHKNISSDLNSISKQTIVALRTSPIDGKGKEKLSVNIPCVKSEQSKLKGPKVKK